MVEMAGWLNGFMDFGLTWQPENFGAQIYGKKEWVVAGGFVWQEI